MFRLPAVSESSTVGTSIPDLDGVRTTTALGIGLGLLDVVTTAEHMLIPPMADGNPLLMAIGRSSPWLAYGGFLLWFLLIVGLALRRRDAVGYAADTYLLIAFSLTGVANAAYVLTGTTVFKEFVGQYTALTHLYILLVAPLASLVVGYSWVRFRRPV